jgi:hypothetical protein
MNDRLDKLRDVQLLTCALIDGEIGDADHRRLESLLFGDPEACELYLDLTTLHAHLIREHGGAMPVSGPPAGLAPTGSAARDRLSTASPFGVGVRGRIRLPRLPWRLAKFAAAASVVLVLGVAVVSAWRTTYADPAGACATLVEARDVEWAECGPPHAVGDRIVPSTVGLNRGTVVIRFDNGAVATLSGPAEMRIEGRKSAELKRGNILVRADRESAGFTLRTSAADYVDLGTEFGVAANEDASSEVHVFAGVVIARPRASDLVVPVLRNEAGRVEADRGDVVAIESNAGKFAGVTTAAPAARAAGAMAAAVPIPLAGGGSRNGDGTGAGGGSPVVGIALPPIRTRGPIPADARVVFLGDRATDYETHLLLIAQAFAHTHAATDRPRLYNAGRTLPLAFAEADVRRFVLAFNPTHAVLEFGPEIAAGPRRVSAGAFEAHLRRLIDRLETEGVEPILCTGFTLGDQQAPCQAVLDEYNAVARRVAAEHGYRLADVDARFRSLERYKLSLVAPNGAVPTFSGYQQIATAVLTAMGYPDSKVDATVQLAPLPGVVTTWRYRLKPPADKLDDARAATLTTVAWPLVGTSAVASPAVPAVASGWRDLVLPQPDDKFLSRVSDASHSATYRDRGRGFATDLCRDKEQTVEAVAVVHSPDARPAFLNTGACVRAAWVNGERVFDNQGNRTGWHAGKERVPVRLVAGANRIVIESGGCFFVSVTDEFDWPVQ